VAVVGAVDAPEPLGQIELATARRMWATNGLGTTLLVQAALPHLIVSGVDLAAVTVATPLATARLWIGAPRRAHRGYDSAFPMMSTVQICTTGG